VVCQRRQLTRDAFTRMTRKKLRSRILVGGSLSLACVAGYLLAALPHPYPVALTMTGYEAAPSGYDPTILFQVTKHTASNVRFQFTVHATNTSGLTSGGAGIYDLTAHGASGLRACIPRGTSGWRGQFVFSASRQRTAWQRRMDSWISRVGLPPIFTAWERTYPQCTNAWSAP
jgi:hypothetical protein